MGWDIQLYLERRVMTQESREVAETIRKLDDKLPEVLTEKIQENVEPTYEWYPCEYMEWMSLSDDDFVKTTTTTTIKEENVQIA